MSVTVKHEGPGLSATDSGSQEEISGIIGTSALVNRVCKTMVWRIQKVKKTRNRSFTMEELDRIKIAGVSEGPGC